MPERSVSDSFWTDPPITRLSPEAKSLYLYTWTNSHNNAAGIYEIGLKTITDETGWSEAIIRRCLDELRPKVDWFEDLNIIWVRAFLKRQSRSPQYLKAVVKSLRNLPEKIIIDFLTFNQQRYNLRLPVDRIDTLSIPYRYPIDTLQSALFCSDLSSAGGEGSIKNSKSSKPGESEGVKGVEVKDELAIIAQAYESNIGMITPAVAEELKDIATVYPAGWFAEAMKEAVENNARKLKYIKAILERWAAEGFKSDRRQIGTGASGRQSRSTRPGKVPTAEELKEQRRRLRL